MPAENPKSPPPAKPAPSLNDLPAQPVDEKEAKGVKGGTALGVVADLGHLPPDPCAPSVMGAVRNASSAQH